jgi:hypothetical protein
MWHITTFKPYTLPFGIHRQGAEKLEGHHSGEEGRASCIGFP